MPQRFWLEVRGGAHVGAGEETQAAGINLEALVDREFAGEINGALGVFRGDFVVVGERFWEKRGSHDEVGGSAKARDG